MDLTCSAISQAWCPGQQLRCLTTFWDQAAGQAHCEYSPLDRGQAEITGPVAPCLHHQAHHFF